MSKFNPTLKLGVFLLILACLPFSAPLTVFAQVARTHNRDTPPLAARPTACLVIAEVQAIVVNGVKQREAGPVDIEITDPDGKPLGLVKIGTRVCQDETVRTKQEDQVTLRFLDAPTGTENLVYLDQMTEVVIGSLCLRSGWLLAQVGVNFKVCVGNTTLGVKKTEFEVSSKSGEPLKVAVFKGTVEVTQTHDQPTLSRAQKTSANQIPKNALIESGILVSEKEQLTVKAESGEFAKKEISLADGRARIDYWSARIRTASQPGNAKVNPNYAADRRGQEFLDARFTSLWQGDAAGFVKMGEVYNDWSMGAKARESLLIAQQKNHDLANNAEFQANLGEAYRLTGNYTLAKTHLRKALDLQPDYSFANYSLGKALRSLFEEGGKNLVLLDDSRRYLSRSVQVGSYGPPLDKTETEKELDRVIKSRGLEFLVNQFKWVSEEKWWCQEKRFEGRTYSGTLDLPELREVGINVSGPATIFILGDQFKIKSGSQILTGNIIGKTSGGYTAVNLRFDNSRISNVSKEMLSLSFRETGNCDQFVLKPGTNKTFGTASMTASDE